MPEPEQFGRLLARDHTVVVTEVTPKASSLDEAVDQLRAVVASTGIERFAVFAEYRSAVVALSLAATAPDAVRCLVLRGGIADVTAFAGSARIQALERLAAGDWELYTDAAAAAFTGKSRPDAARRYAEFFRRHWSPESLASGVERYDTFDATRHLAAVSQPVLVVHRRDAAMPTVEAVEEVASRLPNASLRLLDGDGLFSPFGDAEQAASIVLDFIDDHLESSAAGQAPTHAVQTVMFTDLESSTALTQRLGDEGAQALLRAHNAAVRTALAEHDGREIKHTGDGIMASFASAVSAVTAAIQIQRDIAGSEIRVRVGINAGEPITEDGDLFGTAVQLAARITDRSEPGQVLVSRVVADLCAGKPFKFEPCGEATLKGFDDPVALYEVHPA